MASALKKAYLIAYNSASAVAWTTILGRVALVLYLKGPHLVHLSVDNFARTTQTFASLEILHSLLGSFLFLLLKLAQGVMPQASLWLNRKADLRTSPIY